MKRGEHLAKLMKQRAADREARIIDLVKSKCTVTDTSCWEFNGFRHRQGYGTIWVRGRQWRAHRLMYTKAIGPIPPGLFVCHTCDNTPCCNPAHLFLGTHTDNQRDMIAKNRHSKGRQTHCKRGHPFEGENLQVFDGHRKCKTCNRIRQRMLAGWPRDLAETADVTPHGYRRLSGSAGVP